MTTRRQFLVPAAILVIVATVVILFVRRRDEPAAVVTTSAAPEAKGHDDETNVRVTLTEASLVAAQLDVVPVQVGSAALTTPGLEAPGQVEFDPTRVVLVSPRTDGRVERLSAVDGDQVPAGRAVAWIQSKEFLIAQGDLQQATRRAAILAGGPDAEGANALVRAARQRLTLLGIGPAEIARLERGGEMQMYLPLTAPIGGMIMKTHVLSGQGVTAGQPIFTIADMQAVDVVAAIQERSVPLVRVGQTATVTLTALPTLTLKGHVVRLRGELNQETRTVQAVIRVTNSSGQLRPGMFASVRIGVPAAAHPELNAAGDSASDAVVTVPESAVVTDGDRRYVFVRISPFVGRWRWRHSHRPARASRRLRSCSSAAD